MPHWLIKSVAHRAISMLPGRHRCNALFQKYVTRSTQLTPERFSGRVDYARLHLDHFLELRPQRTEGFTVCELGTGWFPVVPLSLYLCGAGEVWTFDIAPLLTTDQVRETFDRFQECERSGDLARRLPGVRADRLKRLGEVVAGAGDSPPEAVLAQLGIHVRVQDAQQTGLPLGKVDLFTSTGVLEYIPEPVLKNILLEFKRAGSSDAVHSHYLNLVDQYHYFDASITPFNFLRFPKGRWKYLNSPLSWLNRLRISDYRRLLAEAGYQITKEENTSGSREDLRKVPLAPEFRGYSEADLLVLLSWVVAKPNGT
jgi:hypothetical protein